MKVVCRRITSLLPVNKCFDRCQWPRGIRRGSAAAHLMGFRARIPLGGGDGCLSVMIVVCFQVEVSATSWSLVQRSPTDCGVSECDHESSIMMRPWPTGVGGGEVVTSGEKIQYFSRNYFS
jgi:hypothetical protein